MGRGHPPTSLSFSTHHVHQQLVADGQVGSPVRRDRRLRRRPLPIGGQGGKVGGLVGEKMGESEEGVPWGRERDGSPLRSPRSPAPPPTPTPRTWSWTRPRKYSASAASWCRVWVWVGVAGPREGEENKGAEHERRLGKSVVALLALPLPFPLPHLLPPAPPRRRRRPAAGPTTTFWRTRPQSRSGPRCRRGRGARWAAGRGCKRG